MKKIILLGLMLIGHIYYAQSPLSRFNAVASGANTVNFSSTSDGNPTSFLWEFTGANLATSNISNPSVSYPAAGTYTAKLTVTNASGSSVSVRTVKVSSSNILDLGSGRNDDGTMMSDAGVPDSDWTYTDPNGVISTPVTRYAATAAGWSSASTGGVAGITQWITGNNVITGDHYYKSKEFEIPAGVTTAVLNLRSLSFVRNWTYLVKKNTDGTETDTQITATTWMSDGAKGWLNSRSPEVMNYPLTPGKYYIKVKSYTNNTGQRQAIDVNANINFGYGFTFSPIAEFSATPTSTFTGASVQFTNLSQGTPVSTSWNFGDGSNVLTSNQNNPSVTFSAVGNHYAELNADFGNSLASSLRIDNYIQTTQIDNPIVSVTQPNCSVLSGSITVTSPLTGVTYSFDDGNTFQSSNTISGLASGTYLVKVKTSGGAVSQATSAIVNAAPAVPATPVVTITQPTCTVSTGSITITSPASGVEYSFDGGLTYQDSNAKTGLQAGTYQIIVKNSNGCTSATTATINIVDCRDWTKAPNSYIFTGKDANNNEVSGLYIPIKKAYAMWEEQNGLVNDPTMLNGSPTAEVYWEDVPGLIRSTNYILPIEASSGGSTRDGNIKVEIDKAKGKGNAVVALIINNKIVWSWHVWVTDDPTSGVNFGHVRGGAETASYVENGVTKKFTPKWMDRNLGATNKNFIGYDWNKSGGLMYQWGRKDPFPAFQNKDVSMLEINGTAGVKKHLYDYTGNGSTDKIVSMQRPFNDINSNIKYAVNNPLNLIFNNVVAGHAWFAQSIGADNASRKKADLWGDNSGNAYTIAGSTVNTYKPKTPYDPCPNGWRIPSHINNTFATTVANSFSPWGRESGSPGDDLWAQRTPAPWVNVQPTTDNLILKGIKIYPNLGMDFTNTYAGTTLRNMGIYPGNGKYVVGGSTGEFYHQDPHEIVVQTATVANSATPYSYFFYAYGDAGQFTSKPDAALYPNMIGRYYAYPYESQKLSGASACRCIEDKYVNTYSFPTQYFSSTNVVDFTEGLTQPNSYVVTRATTEQEVQIPIAKAFSVYNQYLSDHGMRDFGNLKVNVYWTDNTSLISNMKVMNAPTSVGNIKDGYISVKIPANQSGNALVSLHKDNVTNPAYWSWHIWVNNTPVTEVAYQTEDVILPETSNYVNFTNSGAQPMKSTFMDRNLGATDAFPNVVNPEAPTAAELAMINNSAGMQYQWGREKDPIPSFIQTGLKTASGPEKTGDYSIWKSSGPDSNGDIYPSSFTELNGNTYENTYTKRRDIDYGTAGTSKTEKIQNNLKYSAENPLAYMIPNQKYTNRAEFNVAYGQDWLYSTPNQMMERWGHATQKSPFDPCPGGWRVPDISFTIFDNDPNDTEHADDNKGSSPWYNGFFKSNASVDKFRLHSMGIVQDAGFDIKTPTDMYNGGVPYYSGATVKNGTTVYGYQFNTALNSGNPNTQYKIGNYPATGFRGFRNYDAISSSMKLGVSGVWTAALNSANSYGTAHNLTFETINASSSKLAAMNNFYINHPMNAMNVRCIKEEPRFGQILGPASNSGTTYKAGPEIENTLSEQKEKIEVYPNPVHNILNIDAAENKDYYYQIYNISGQMVKQGKFENKKTDLSSLISGVYLIKINNSEKVVKFIKQ